jgi:hypothetical protein
VRARARRAGCGARCGAPDADRGAAGGQMPRDRTGCLADFRACRAVTGFAASDCWFRNTA